MVAWEVQGRLPHWVPVGTQPALQHCWLALHLAHAAGDSALLFGQTGKERQRGHLLHGDILYRCFLP